MDTLEKNDLILKFLEVGEEKFYQLILLYALNKIISIEQNTKDKNSEDNKDTEEYNKSPEIELLEFYDQALISFRRNGDEIFLDMARAFRRAAHKVYRTMLKKNLTERNLKFLNVVGY